MARAKLTKRTVDAASPAERDYFLWDTDVRGFGLKVTPAGGKVYLFQYRIDVRGLEKREPTKRYKIGRHGSPWTPESARGEAERIAAIVSSGEHPKAKREEAKAAVAARERTAKEEARLAQELEFCTYAAGWLDELENVKRRRAATIADATLAIRNHYAPKLKGKPMPHIGRADIQAIVDAIPPSMTATRRNVFAYGSSLFGWAEKRGDIPGNPFRTMEKPIKPKSRVRALKDGELARVWRATQRLANPYGAYFRFLILTGKRRSDVAQMDWSELDRDAKSWSIPGDRVKNDFAEIVPLSVLMMAELEGLALAAHERQGTTDAEGWPLTGPVLTIRRGKSIASFSRARKALDEAIAKVLGGGTIPAFVVHDFRRTIAAGMQRNGIRLEVTEAVLNHASGSRSGIVAVYQVHDWRDEKREALEMWAAHVAKVLAIAESKNVVSIVTEKRA